MTEYIQVFTTVESEEQGRRIARALVQKRLAACGQVMGPILSTYWWKGNLEEAGEWFCILKSRGDLFDVLEKEIRALHSYEVPEIVAVPIATGTRDYLQWIDEEVEGN